MRQATQTENDEVKQIEDDDEELVAPSTRDVENSLEILKNLSLFNEKRGDQMQDLINKFETLLTRDKVEKCKQVKIASCFVKKKKNLHCHALIFSMFIGSFTFSMFIGSFTFSMFIGSFTFSMFIGSFTQTYLGLLEAFS